MRPNIGSVWELGPDGPKRLVGDRFDKVIVSKITRRSEGEYVVLTCLDGSTISIHIDSFNTLFNEAQ